MNRITVARSLFGLMGAFAMAFSATSAVTIDSYVSPPSVVVVSDFTNVSSRAGDAAPQIAAAASPYVVLRDNFTSFAKCESYRRNYVIHYAYHRDSYCTTGKKSNGRHWLYVWYDYSCVDRVGPRRDEV